MHVKTEQHTPPRFSSEGQSITQKESCLQLRENVPLEPEQDGRVFTTKSIPKSPVRSASNGPSTTSHTSSRPSALSLSKPCAHDSAFPDHSVPGFKSPNFISASGDSGVNRFGGDEQQNSIAGQLPGLQAMRNSAHVSSSREDLPLPRQDSADPSRSDGGISENPGEPVRHIILMLFACAEQFY